MRAGHVAGESKALFWRAFDQGKVFARRQTFWDALFGILASHDKHWLQLLIELIIKTVSRALLVLQCPCKPLVCWHGQQYIDVFHVLLVPSCLRLHATVYICT